MKNKEHLPVRMGSLEHLLIHGISVLSPTTCQASSSVLTTVVTAAALPPHVVSDRGKEQRSSPQAAQQTHPGSFYRVSLKIPRELPGVGPGFGFFFSRLLR